MTQSHEFDAKRALLKGYLSSCGSDAVLLAARPNLYWLALGGEVDRTTKRSSAFVVTPDNCVLLCPAEDSDRLRQEEVRGLELEIACLDRLDPSALVGRARALVPKQARWRCDTPGLGLEFDAALHEFRRALAPEEVVRLRKLGQDASTAIEEVASECFRGIQEREAAALLAAECYRRHIKPASILVGADERSESYSRPSPKGGAAEHVLVLALVAMRGGLHVALSRTICLSNPTADFIQRFTTKMMAVARLFHASRPGASLGEAVRSAFATPEEMGGSLGGLCGYAVPEVEAFPDCELKLATSHAIAWSVCAPGNRCEDTILVNDTRNELLTIAEGWPRRRFQVDDRSYDLPDLMLL